MYALKAQLEEAKRERDQLELTFEKLGDRIRFANASEEAKLIAEQEQVEEQLIACEKKIAYLDMQTRDFRDVDLIEKQLFEKWHAHQHDIDFRVPLEHMRKIVQKFHIPTGGAAVFVVPKRTDMRADSLLHRLNRWLLDVQKARLPATYKITLNPANGLTGTTFMSALHGYLPFTMGGELNQQIESAIDLLYANYPEANTCIAFEVRITSKPSPSLLEQFIRWFLDQFWKPLVDKLPTATQKTPMLRVLAFIMTDLDHSLIPPDVCVAESTDGRGILINCMPWEIDDVETWLWDYSHLTRYLEEYDATRITEFAEDAHSFAGGIPSQTWYKLDQNLKEALNHLRSKIEHERPRSIPIQ